MIIMRAVLMLWCTFLISEVMSRPADRENEIGGVDVERTVGQVQAILEQNKALPRLTREQIVALLEDITSEDAKYLSRSVESLSNSVDSSTLESLNKTKYELQRSTAESISESSTQFPPQVYNTNAIDTGSASSSVQEVKMKADIPKTSADVMVVLPYTLDGTTLDELYTRPPRVTLVPAYTLVSYSSSQLKEKQTKPAQESNEDITVIPLNQSSASSTTATKVDEKNSLGALDVDPGMTSNLDASQNSTVYPDISGEVRDFLNNHGLVSNPDVVNSDVLSNFKPLPSAQMEFGEIGLPEKYHLSYDFSRDSGIADGSVKNNEGVSSERLVLPYDYDQVKGKETYELDALPSDMKATLMHMGFSPEQLPDIEAIATKDSELFKVIPLKNGPDPLYLSDPDNLANELFKRQNSNETSSSESNSSPVSITASTTTTTEESRNPSLGDLADSFGGPANIDPSESQLPPPKKNGFYFSLDWNSFLEVGDGDSKVNIRFEPKLGDPQMFLPVSVP